MSFYIFRKAKYAPYLAIIYGVIMFVSGCLNNKLAQESTTIKSPAVSQESVPLKPTINPSLPTSSLDIFNKLFAALLSFGMFKSFQDMIEDEGKEKLKEYKKDFLSERINNLLYDLDAASIEPEIKKQCINILKEIRDEDIIAKRQAAIKIVDFLKNNKNFNNLVHDIFKSQFETSVSKEYQDLFKKDIQNCLEWIKCSLTHFRSCRFNIDKLASANAKKMGGGMAPYTEALDEIQTRLENHSNHTGVVKDFIDKLKTYLSNNLPNK